MKRNLLAIAGGLMLLASCEEKAPIINFSDAVSVDTTYIELPAPAADPHVVLVEEFTGAKCSNCPAGHVQLKSIKSANPDRMISIAYYITNNSLTIPPYSEGARYDFRSDTPNVLATAITGFAVSALPSAFIDRVPVAGSIILPRTAWSDAFNRQKAVADSINMSMTSAYDETAGKYKITVTLKYTAPISYKHNLTLVALEDEIVDVQEYPGYPIGPFESGFDTAYKFEAVFREMITAAPLGDPIMDTMLVKQAGRVYRRTYTYTPKATSPAIVPAHVRIVAFVNSANTASGDYRVLQATETKLIP
jgi:hypothetical protein